jgi:hypothetical protein
MFSDLDGVRERDGWRLLAPAPMLLTLAEIFNDHRFERAAEDAWHLALVTPNEAAAFLDDHRSRGRRGFARFARWIDCRSARSRPSQSGFEPEVFDLGKFRADRASGEVVNQGLTPDCPRSLRDTELPQIGGVGHG